MGSVLGRPQHLCCLPMQAYPAVLPRGAPAWKRLLLLLLPAAAAATAVERHNLCLLLG